jgi:hypothetical protein
LLPDPCFGLPDNTPLLLAQIPAEAWESAYDAHDEVRDGAWLAELAGLLNLSGWPPGMRVIARKKRPHPGAQLRITDADGMRVTVPRRIQWRLGTDAATVVVGRRSAGPACPRC